jgi:hypothetical protein
LLTGWFQECGASSICLMILPLGTQTTKKVEPGAARTCLAIAFVQ